MGQKSHHHHHHLPPGNIRIIAGVWRHRLIPVLMHPGLRPTPSRVRETLFNWLAPTITGSRCLVLFAGSGALGFEALSRGASSVVMIEQAASVVSRLRETQKMLGAAADINQADVLAWLSSGGYSGAPFDVVFVDPPFSEPIIKTCLELLLKHPWLKKTAQVYVEAEHAISAAPPWRMLKTSRAGRVHFALLSPETVVAVQ